MKERTYSAQTPYKTGEFTGFNKKDSRWPGSVYEISEYLFQILGKKQTS